MKKYGIDTETYNVGGDGLLSVQIYNDEVQEYFGMQDNMDSFDDEDIRAIILDDVFDFFESLNDDSIFYFFNLKFDFSQMEKYAVTHYKITDDFFARKGEINIIQSPNDVYKVSFRTYKTGKLIVFVDLFQLLHTSLESACQAFLGKGKIELESKNFAKRVPLSLEKEYAMRDAQLTYELAIALGDIHGFDLTEKMTIGARTLSLFKYALTHKNVDIMGDIVEMPGPNSKDLWDYFCFTENNIPFFEEKIRPSVRGGVCQAFRVGMFNDCIHLDLNSAHPSQMVKNIPYGPILEEKPEGEHTYIVYPTGDFSLKNDGLKMMQFRNKADCERFRSFEQLKPGYYVENFYLDGSFGIWKDEYDLLLTQYDFIGTESFIYFRTRHDERLTAFINALYNGKSHSEGAKRQVYKRLQNSLYGKFLTRLEGETILYNIKSEVLTSNLYSQHQNGFFPDASVSRKTVTEKGRKGVNLPLGSWIAMMTRVTLMKSAVLIPRKNLLYCDTDSLIFVRYAGWEKDFKIGKNLGEWGVESKPSSVNVVGPKTYQELIDGKSYTKCAGLTARISDKIPFGDLKEGYETVRLKAERNPETLAISLVERPFIVSSKPTVYKGGH